MREPLQSQNLLKTDKDANSRTLALANIALAQAKAGDIKGTLATTNSIANTTYHTLTIARIALAQAEDGNIKGAKENISQAVETAETIANTSYHTLALARIAWAPAETGG